MPRSRRSLWLLIDGYNVVAPSVPPSRQHDAGWLHRERMRLIDRLVEHLNETVRERTCVVFDAANPPPDRSHRFTVAGVDVRFAVGYAEADDLIEKLIAAHSAPKRLAVVSSDRRIQVAAKRRGCTFFDSDPWLDDLLEGKPRLSAELGDRALGGAGQGSGATEAAAEEKPKTVSEEETARWLKDFGFDSKGS